MFHDAFHSSQKSLIFYWICRISIYCLECLSHFQLQLQGEGTYKIKKLHVKTFLFSSTNRGTKRYNGWKTCISKLLLFVQKQLQNYNIRDIMTVLACKESFFANDKTNKRNICLSRWNENEMFQNEHIYEMKWKSIT